MSQLYIQAFNYGNLWQRGDFQNSLAIPAYDTVPTAGTMTSSLRNGLIAVETSTNKLKWYSNGIWYDGASGTVNSITVAYPLTGGTITSSGTIGINKSDVNTDGYLSAADWATFNNKQDSGNYIISLTGDVTASGPGSATATIANNAVTYPKIQNLSRVSRLLGSSSTNLAVQEIILGSGLSMNGNTLIVTASGSGTVTSVQLTAGTGISLSGTNPITTSGTITIVNSAPDQTVVLTAGTGISISGTYPNFTITATSSGSGTVTSIATAGLISGGPITTTGTITTLMNTNKLVGRSTAGAGIMEEITVGSGLTLTGGTLTNTATPTPLGYYGAWQDQTTQSAAANNTGYAMKFGIIDVTPNGISIVNNGAGNPTRITFAYTGVYNLQFSAQFQNTNNQLQDVTIWLRLNGTDIPGSAGFISVPNSHGGTAGHIIASWNYVLDVVGGQYYELIWSTTDYTSVTMQYYAAGSPPPAAASVILTVTQQSGIMAGTGITAINSLTGAVQTMTSGTTGTDFGISSSGTTHVFNLPVASATNTGKLSSTDWSTFNAKQAAGNYITALTGDITASGPGSVAATIAANAVTYAKMQAASATSKLIGSSASSTALQEISLGSGLSLSGTTLSVSGSGGTVTSVSALTLGTTGTDLSSSVANGTTTPVITLNVPTASATNRGVLSSTDWSTFNNKQPAGNYITGLTGDVTASGPGSAAATVKSNLKIGSISLTITGSGTVPSTGAFGAVIVPYAGTITDWYLVTTGDSPSGSIVIDVKRSGTSIIGAGNKPTLSSGTSANAAVSGWTSTAVSANDAFTFNIDSASSLTGVTLMIKITKT